MFGSFMSDSADSQTHFQNLLQEKQLKKQMALLIFFSLVIELVFIAGILSLFAPR